ncbi:uncharacterized protein LOC9634885 isoform X1 [Selaginella moellendorffii]|nr:uncharacterized protein LOC9634885 isoform X1 [Selaginella moellendorffii]XP_024542818.1 uncharacterized protein LOC9634885 isoform X1 [Selaginella moellendorffii]|eukprot:XP_002982039.2 uncharacterized protein LOC9634885 isoform X1 [Selaginella moellendorffii]
MKRAAMAMAIELQQSRLAFSIVSSAARVRVCAPLGKCAGLGNLSRRNFSQAAEALEINEVEARPEVQVKDDKIISPRKFLLGKSEKELQDLCEEMGEKRFRGKQMYLLLYKVRKAEIQEFTNLSKGFREKLISEGWEVGRSPIHHKVNSVDGTIKVLLKLKDSRLIETVGIPADEENNRLTVCVSSQVGCPLRCAFCATGKGGFTRSLKPHEIIEQVLVMEEIFKQRVSNVVFMGMGEPMLNMASVLAAHRCLNEDIGIGQRMITISTVGVPNSIRKLAAHKLQSTLAVSLHAPNQRLREQIVPSAKSYPLDALMEDCKEYFSITGRRVSFEYTLLAGVNDSKELAFELGELLHHWDMSHHVNLIPYNPVADSLFQRPWQKSVQTFVETLAKCRVNASVRQTRGLDANAACGQLRNQFQKTPLEDESLVKSV